MIALEIVGDYRLEKVDFADLVRDAKSVPGVSPFLPILSRT